MSKITHLSVDWMEGWANSPRWIVTFDAEAPEVYRDIGDGLLLSVVGERADWFAYTGPGTGHGGRSFPITMVDGSQRVLIGPWSSDSGEVNARVPEAEHVAEAVADNCATGITVAGILRYIDEHPDCGFGLAQVTWGDCIWYQPTRNGEIKPDKMTKVLKTLRPSPAPALKVQCPYCGGCGWKEQRVGGSDIAHTWRCVQCSGTGFVWTEGGAW